MLNSIPKWMYPILLWLLPEKILGISTARILSNSPEIDEATKAVSRVIKNLMAEGKTQPEAEAAAAQMIAKKRVMTLEEELAWMNRSGSPG